MQNEALYLYFWWEIFCYCLLVVVVFWLARRFCGFLVVWVSLLVLCVFGFFLLFVFFKCILSPH